MLQKNESKKSLKIPNQSVNRRTDIVIDKQNRSKENTTIYKTLHRKLKIEQQRKNNDLQNTTQKTKDRATQNPSKPTEKRG